MNLHLPHKPNKQQIVAEFLAITGGIKRHFHCVNSAFCFHALNIPPKSTPQPAAARWPWRCRTRLLARGSNSPRRAIPPSLVCSGGHIPQTIRRLWCSTRSANPVPCTTISWASLLPAAGWPWQPRRRCCAGRWSRLGRRTRRNPASGNSLLCNRTCCGCIELFEGESFRYQEWREGSDPMTARQPGLAAKVPRSARKRGRCGERQRNQRLPSSISLQHRTPTEELRWAKYQRRRHSISTFFSKASFMALLTAGPNTLGMERKKDGSITLTSRAGQILAEASCRYGRREAACLRPYGEKRFCGYDGDYVVGGRLLPRDGDAELTVSREPV